MALHTLHKFSLCILFLGRVVVAKCDLTLDPQDLTVVVGQDPLYNERAQVSLILKSDPPLSENISVKLCLSYADIIQVDPAEVSFEAGLLSQKFVIKVLGLSPGHVEITANVSPPIVNAASAYVKVISERSPDIVVISTIVGWTYFFVWSISFYPQMYENWKRKSVVGLNFDFLLLNLTGFSLYALFNCALYWIPTIQDQYFARHPHSSIPVLPNDIFFALHAIIVTLITILQCCIYERGGQTVSVAARSIQGVFFVFLFISLLCSVFGVLVWLDFFYYCSYVKLAITLIKYVPQGYMNYRRQSTIGWSIGNIFCDFTGGVLSVLQMVLDAYNYDDWSSIFGSPTKFGLGLFSILFDIFFMVQHYILYRHQDNHPSGYERLQGHDFPEASSNTTTVEPSEEDVNTQGVLKEGASSGSVT